MDSCVSRWQRLTRCRERDSCYYVYAPVTDDDILDTVGSSTITVGFNPILKEVDYDPKRIILPLLKKVRELLDMDTPPESADGCKDCLKG